MELCSNGLNDENIIIEIIKEFMLMNNMSSVTSEQFLLWVRRTQV